MSFNLAQLNWIAIFAVAVGTFFLGAAWYTLLGPLWVKYNGYTPERVAAMQKARPPAVFFGGMLLSYFVFATVLAIVLRNLPVSSWQAGAAAGAVLWLAIAVPIGVTGWLASDRHFGVHAIDLAYQFVFLTAGGAVLAGWR